MYSLINSTLYKGVTASIKAESLNITPYYAQCLVYNEYEPFNLIFIVFYIIFMLIIIFQKIEIKHLKKED